MGGSDYIIPISSNSRFANAAGTYYAACDTDIGGWDFGNKFWIVLIAGCDPHGGCVETTMKLQWSDDAGASWYDLGAAGKLKQAAGLGDPGVSACQSATESGVVQAGNSFVFSAKNQGEYIEMRVAVDPADADDNKTYSFRLWDSTEPAALGAVEVEVTTTVGGTTTVESDATRCFPYSVVRDSNTIPYALVMDNTTLKVYKGDATIPTGWSSATVGDGEVKSEGIGKAHLVTGTYDSTEYLWVFRQKDDNKLYVNRSTIGVFSFVEGDKIEVGDTDAGVGSFGGVDYDAAGEMLGLHYIDNGNDFGYFRNSTDGGATWSGVVETWNKIDAGKNLKGAGVAWDGSYFQLAIGYDLGNGKSKRWSSGSGLEYWDGDSWESDDGSQDGVDMATPYLKYRTTQGQATANIMIFPCSELLTKASISYSRTGGTSWTAVGDMGTGPYTGNPSISIKTEVGETDDFYSFASNENSDSNDANYRLYDYSETGFGAWTLIWDTGDSADTVAHFAGLLKQQDGWVDFAYQWFDDTASTYYCVFNQYEEGTTPSGDSIVQLIVDGGVHQLIVDGGVIQKIVT